MIVAGAVVHTAPGAAHRVAARLGHLPGVEIAGTDEDARVAVVWSAPSGRDLETAAEALVRDDDEILGVYPTFVGPE